MVSLGTWEFSSLWLVLGTISRWVPGRMRADSASQPLWCTPTRKTAPLNTAVPENPDCRVSECSEDLDWTGEQNDGGFY